jgi:hypothetical protein
MACSYVLSLVSLLFNNNNNKHADAGTNYRFTHLRALFGTPSTAAFWPMQLALLGIIPSTEVTQRLVLWLGFYDAGTTQVSLACTNLDLLATKAPPLNQWIPTSVRTGRMSLILDVLTDYCAYWAHKLVILILTIISVLMLTGAKMTRSVSCTHRTLGCVKGFCLTGISMFNIIITSVYYYDS